MSSLLYQTYLHVPIPFLLIMCTSKIHVQQNPGTANTFLTSRGVRVHWTLHTMLCALKSQAMFLFLRKILLIAGNIPSFYILFAVKDVWEKVGWGWNIR